MADQDPSAMFGLDGPNLEANPSFLDDTGVLGRQDRDAKTESPVTIANSGDSDAFYQPGWAFHDSPQYESFDGVATSAAPESIFQTASWDLPPPQQPQPMVGLNNPDLSNVSPTSLYADAPASYQAEPNASTPNAPALSQEALSTLTPAQQQKLRNIAMPPHLQYHSPRSEPSPTSPAGSNKTNGGASSPENASTSTKPARKRKSSADGEEDDDDDDEHQPVKKTAHNMIEKRYRTNLNDKIAALRDSVPSLRIMSKSARGEDTTEDREELHGLTPAHKLNKATVLSKATEYIRHLEKRNARLMDENSAMQQRISAFEKLFMAGAMNGAIQQQPTTPMTYAQDAQQFISTPIGTPSGNEPSPPGMIPVPDDMKRIIQAQMAANQPYPVPQQPYQSTPALVRQQQIQQQQQQQIQQNRWRNGAPYLGKLMVGSLAGLMVLEAMRENEQSNEVPEGRGLLGLPSHVLMRMTSSIRVNVLGYHISASRVIFSLKMLMLFGTLLWVFLPSIFASSPKSKKRRLRLRLNAAPPPASPLHVRQQAWLTAIQTVWVPQHNFFLEAAALILKTMKLSLRNAIGVRGYQMLTGLTEEQETARVKAWSIALDAQLAGGDVEINKSRLMLTLLASGTLPDTPLRLMMKALHVRLLLWGIGNNDLHLGLLNAFAAKRARAMWSEARQLNRIMSQLRRASPTQGDDEFLLPDHLALLLEQDCDDVLNDDLVQRAHNLAWNLPTADGTSGNVDGMDDVVDDAAVRSPMDAVAAWWSSQKLHRTIIGHLRSKSDSAELRDEIKEAVNLAINVAPVGSAAHARAIIGRTVLVPEKRGTSIAAALHAVGPPTAGVPREYPNMMVFPPYYLASNHDLGTALRCAMVIAHLEKGKRTAPPHEGLRMVESIVVPETMANMSLLACTAAYTLMEQLFNHRAAAETFSYALERLSGSLRVWVGGVAGSRSSLDENTRHQMVERCLAITKSVVGMDTDTGYGSMSEAEDELAC